MRFLNKKTSFSSWANETLIKSPEPIFLFRLPRLFQKPDRFRTTRESEARNPRGLKLTYGGAKVLRYERSWGNLSMEPELKGSLYCLPFRIPLSDYNKLPSKKKKKKKVAAFLSGCVNKVPYGFYFIFLEIKQTIMQHIY